LYHHNSPLMVEMAEGVWCGIWCYHSPKSQLLYWYPYEWFILVC
jgi:hypothetical protein